MGIVDTGVHHQVRAVPPGLRSRGRLGWSNFAATDQRPPVMYTLLFLEPGHFHAALTLREKIPGSTPPPSLRGPGLERESFIALVHSFNARDEQPTNWSIRVHEPSDPERALIEERAGRRCPCWAEPAQARHHRPPACAGLHVLADKPWLTDSAALPNLEQSPRVGRSRWTS